MSDVKVIREDPVPVPPAKVVIELDEAEAARLLYVLDGREEGLNVYVPAPARGILARQLRSAGIKADRSPY